MQKFIISCGLLLVPIYLQAVESNAIIFSTKHIDSVFHGVLPFGPKTELKKDNA
jgi:hypothetical protein